jgi:hypothetical protein
MYVGECGYRFPKRRVHEVLETVEAAGFAELDQSKTEYLDPGSDAGWLRPDGKFFPCGYTFHDIVAREVLKTTVKQLERGGWIRVQGEGALLFCERTPTDAQRKWAEEHGHTLEDDLGPPVDYEIDPRPADLVQRFRDSVLYQFSA